MTDTSTRGYRTGRRADKVEPGLRFSEELPRRVIKRAISFIRVIF